MAHRELRRGVFQTTTIIAVALLLLILFVSAAFFFTIPGDQLAEQSRKTLFALREQRGNWEERRPVAFRYLVERRCRCSDDILEPYVATEASGVRRAEYRWPQRRGNHGAANAPPEPVWIDDLFAIAEQALGDGRQVEVDFDFRYGYPSKLAVTGGGEFSESDARYVVLDFEVLDYGPADVR